MTRTSLNLGKNWEQKVPFSLGVVVSGKFLFTAGITARDNDGNVVGVNSMREQVAQCFANLSEVLDAAGASWANVVKYTIYTTDIQDYNEHTKDIRTPFFVDGPAATLIEVRKLIDPKMLVEIEAIVHID
ncbi:hypothetical protein LKR43_06045 [Pusillimonas sp. MFBS29]|uniref:RidA family protein n=1 Tax=Pusillimonas sp. MFBS29 TaxID=2886690 RepID=UPI001D101092|nr:Rid family hydrolase [Pusillimonas sp. MFBS29]MCC2595896.1 hypothetical protein [Pusillimonas sp. MFBS29]